MNLKKLLLIFTAAMLVVSLSITAFATGDTGATEETVPTTVDWTAARLEQMEAWLQELVDAGTITREQADAYLAQLTACATGCGNQGQCGRNACGSQSQCGRNGCSVQRQFSGNGGQSRGMGRGGRGR